MGTEKTTGAAPKRQLMWAGLMLLAVLFGLCTVFATVVTAAQAWQEHARAQWPEVTAHVEKCGLERSSTGRRQRFHIRCRLSYSVGGEPNATNIYSAYAPSREVWQYPPNQVGPLEQWVEEHPAGTPILVRYDPARHTNVVLVATDMPLAGPRTQSNIKVLELFAGGFVVLLLLARITRPRSMGTA